MKKKMKAPKEFHSMLDEMYNQVYRDREKSNEFGLAKQKKMACADRRVIVPMKMPFKSNYDSYSISLSEFKF